MTSEHEHTTDHRSGIRFDPVKVAMNGAVIASVTLAAVVAMWSSRQVGGVDQRLLNQLFILATPLALVAVGTTIVLIAGGFDLSAAGVVSIVNATAATMLTRHNMVVVVVAMLLLSSGIGMVNGLLVTRLKLSSLAATLAVFLGLAGASLIVLPVPGGSVPPEYVERLTGRTAGGWTRAVVILAVLCLAWTILTRTQFGTWLRAVGGDADAARLSGVPVRRTTVQAYALAGAFYGLGGLYLTAVISSGDPKSGEPFLLASFAAVALGGSSFAGGSGSAAASVIGAITLTTIPKALFVFGAADYLAGVFNGIVVIIAVLVGIAAAQLRHRREIRRRESNGPRS